MNNIRIDFTDGRVFSQNQRLTGLDLEFWKAARLDFPWTWNMMVQIKSDRDLSSGEDENTLFYTGTNSQIKYKQEYSQMTKGEMCECCGGKINRFPWDRDTKYSFLCISCANRMDKEYGADMFGMPKRKELSEQHWWLVL